MSDSIHPTRRRLKGIGDNRALADALELAADLFLAQVDPADAALLAGIAKLSDEDAAAAGLTDAERKAAGPVSISRDFKTFVVNGRRFTIPLTADERARHGVQRRLAKQARMRFLGDLPRTPATDEAEDEAPAKPRRTCAPMRPHAVDGMERPARGKTRLSESHLLAFRLFEQDHRADVDPEAVFGLESPTGAQLDAGALEYGRRARTGKGIKRGRQILTMRATCGLPAIFPQETAERADAMKARRKTEGDWTQRRIGSTVQNQRDQAADAFRQDRAGLASLVGSDRADESLDVEEDPEQDSGVKISVMEARSWRRGRLQSRIGKDNFELLLGVARGDTLGGIEKRLGVNQRQATNALMRALDALVSAYFEIDDAFKAKIERLNRPPVYVEAADFLRELRAALKPKRRVLA